MFYDCDFDDLFRILGCVDICFKILDNFEMFVFKVLLDLKGINFLCKRNIFFFYEWSVEKELFLCILYDKSYFLFLIILFDFMKYVCESRNSMGICGICFMIVKENVGLCILFGMEYSFMI